MTEQLQAHNTIPQEIPSFAFSVPIVTRKDERLQTQTISYEEAPDTIEVAQPGERFALDLSGKNYIGTLNLCGIRMPSIARISVDNEAGAEKPTSDFLLVDMRGFTFDSAATKLRVGPFSYDPSSSLPGAPKRRRADYALVNLNEILQNQAPTEGQASNLGNPLTALSMNHLLENRTRLAFSALTGDVFAYNRSTPNRMASMLVSDRAANLVVGQPEASDHRVRLFASASSPVVTGYKPRFAAWEPAPTHEPVTEEGLGDILNAFLAGLAGIPAKPNTQATSAPKELTDAEKAAEKLRKQIEDGKAFIDADIARAREAGMPDKSIRRKLLQAYHSDKPENSGIPSKELTAHIITTFDPDSGKPKHPLVSGKPDQTA